MRPQNTHWLSANYQAHRPCAPTPHPDPTSKHYLLPHPDAFTVGDGLMSVYLAPCIVHCASCIVHCVMRIMGLQSTTRPHLKEVAAVKKHTSSPKSKLTASSRIEPRNGYHPTCRDIALRCGAYLEQPITCIHSPHRTAMSLLVESNLSRLDLQTFQSKSVILQILFVILPLQTVSQTTPVG